MLINFDPLIAEISQLKLAQREGRVMALGANLLTLSGLDSFAGNGDLVMLYPQHGAPSFGEVLSMSDGLTEVLPERGTAGFSRGDRALLLGPVEIAPHKNWLGRVIDPFGRALDERPLFSGTARRSLLTAPPPAAQRRRLGARLGTSMAVFNTMLPIVTGQRVGLFAGSGVGKSSLLAKFARGLEADVVVLALIGERGHELRHFLEDVLGPEGLKRSVVVAATSDQSAMTRRRAAWMAMTIAEYFRDLGGHVLFLADSLTRFAEAHREIAVASGEVGSQRGYPPSTSRVLMELCERAGPGPEASGGDITGVFSVLVAGSDMEEPVADIVRGTLDGHIVLDRSIAEAGRYPAVDVLRSVSRSLPAAASADENALIGLARKRMGDFAEAELMIRAGLYKAGSDPDVDLAIAARPKLETFLRVQSDATTDISFERLRSCLDAAEVTPAG